MIDITPIHNEKLDCFQDTVATVASYYNADFELMCLNCWGFGFKQSEQNGEYVIMPKSINNLTFLKQCHGIGIDFFSSEDVYSILEQIELQISKKNPIAVQVDAYYIPWDRSYQKLHNDRHILLITGIDYEKKEVICLDSFYEIQAEGLSFEFFERAAKGYINFSRHDIKRNTDEYNDLIIRAMSPENYRNSFKDMYMFADTIENVFVDYKAQLNKSENIWYFPIVFSIGRVILGRKSFSLSLEYLMRKCYTNKFLEVVEGLDRLADRWSGIRSLLIKGCLTDNTTKISKNLASKIRVLAIEEETIYHMLLSRI